MSVLQTTAQEFTDDPIRNAVVAAAYDLMANIRRRIHNKSEASDESSLGNYNPAYFRKRAKQGLENPDINLQTKRGQLRASYGQGIASNSDIVLGFDDPNQVGNYSLQNIFTDRWAGHGGVWSPSKDELTQYGKVLNNYMEQGLRKFWNDGK